MCALKNGAGDFYASFRAISCAATTDRDLGRRPSSLRAVKLFFTETEPGGSFEAVSLARPETLSETAINKRLRLML